MLVYFINTNVQPCKKTTASAYFTSKQILPFGFAGNSMYMWLCYQIVILLYIAKKQ